MAHVGTAGGGCRGTAKNVEVDRGPWSGGGIRGYQQRRPAMARRRRGAGRWSGWCAANREAVGPASWGAALGEEESGNGRRAEEERAAAAAGQRPEGG